MKLNAVTTEAAFLFKGWLIIQMVGYATRKNTPFVKISKWKDIYITWTYFYFSSSKILSLMYCSYFVNTFSQEKLNIQQFKILYMSKDQGISLLLHGVSLNERLKVLKLKKKMSMTTSLKIPLLIVCFEGQTYQPLQIKRERHWWWFPLSPSLSLKLHKVICDSLI